MRFDNTIQIFYLLIYHMFFLLNLVSRKLVNLNFAVELFWNSERNIQIFRVSIETDRLFSWMHLEYLKSYSFIQDSHINLRVQGDCFETLKRFLNNKAKLLWLGLNLVDEFLVIKSFGFENDRFCIVKVQLAWISKHLNAHRLSRLQI